MAEARGTLVLSRKLHEVICIGPDVEVMIVELRGDKVKLGVSAPKSVQVDRLEVRRAKERQMGHRKRIPTPQELWAEATRPAENGSV